MQRSDLSLKALEVFQLAAMSGSIQAVAKETGLSISTVSHHLSGLEDRLGVALLNHKQRPMTLTPSGVAFLTHVDQALKLIAKARSEITLGSIADAQHLRLGLIEDFDSEIGPEMAVFLSAGMPKCNFAHFTKSSSEILGMLRRHELDVGVASLPNEDLGDIKDRPLIRDPFVLALPANSTIPPDQFFSGQSGLPLLRYARSQQISKQINVHLQRLKINLPNRFEVESNQTIMAMVAASAGWAVTTPTCYFRARRFHRQVTLHPLPIKNFARYISLFHSADCSDKVVEMIDVALRNLVEKQLLEPVYETAPWLKDSFHLLAPDDRTVGD
jgi:DNA-binding transcriptional LysR family regulator